MALLLPIALHVASAVSPLRALSARPPLARARSSMLDTQAAKRLGVEAISIPEEGMFGGRPFPLTLSPAHAGELALWADVYRDELLHLVEEYDAILLRGFHGATTAMDFSNFVHALRLGSFEMGCSAAPRTNIAPGVFTANEAPPTEPIPFHHEMAQCAERPEYVIFFCEKPAAAHGATPIIPSHAVVEHLEEHFPAVAQRYALQTGCRTPMVHIPHRSPI